MVCSAEVLLGRAAMKVRFRAISGTKLNDGSWPKPAGRGCHRKRSTPLTHAIVVNRSSRPEAALELGPGLGDEAVVGARLHDALEGYSARSASLPPHGTAAPFKSLPLPCSP